jgi:large subunit ribosomal protein L3
MIGIIGKKKEMAHLFDENGIVIPVSIVEVPPNWVVKVKKKEGKDGYHACVIGVGEKKNPNRPYSGIFKKSGIKPVEKLKEVRNPPEEWKVGDKLTVKIFREGEKIDVVGYSKGRGFTGVMKRYGWHGGPGGHGSKFHRAPGAIGMSKTPGRVIKGHKLPGRMGNKKVTIKNLKVVKIEEEKNLIYIKGSIPGAINSWTFIKKK